MNFAIITDNSIFSGKYCCFSEVLSYMSNSVTIKYRSAQEKFLNANFVWNQDEVPQNSR